MDMKRNWIRLPLDGAHNVRELGGLPAKGGRQTAWHRFLRADSLEELTDRDTELLLGYGVNTVIDLRSPSETVQHPDYAGLLARVEYHNIPFMEQDLSPEGQAWAKEQLADLSSLYISLLKRKNIVKAVLEQIAAAGDGCLLFHCAVGKDRTGVLALLLLMLAGVDKQDCQTNYMQSFTNLTRREVFRKLKDSEYAKMVQSDVEYIEAAYDYVMAWDQGIDGFLKDCRITADCIADIRCRMLENEG